MVRKAVHKAFLNALTMHGKGVPPRNDLWLKRWATRGFRLLLARCRRRFVEESGGNGKHNRRLIAVCNPISISSTSHNADTAVWCWSGSNQLLPFTHYKQAASTLDNCAKNYRPKPRRNCNLCLAKAVGAGLVLHIRHMYACIFWRGSMVKTSVSGWRSFPDLCLMYVSHVITSWVGQPTRPTQPSIPLGSVNV